MSRKGGGNPKELWNEGPVSGLWEIELELRAMGERNKDVQTTISCGLSAFQRPINASAECIRLSLLVLEFWGQIPSLDALFTLQRLRKHY